MADTSDIEIALAALISASVYPNSTSSPSIAGATVSGASVTISWRGDNGGTEAGGAAGAAGGPAHTRAVRRRWPRTGDLVISAAVA